MRTFVSSAAALALLAGVAAAQSPQNPTAPAASGEDAAPPHADSNTGAAPSSPPGATRQTVPSKNSPENAALDKLPIMAWPIRLSDADKRRLYESAAANDKAPVQNIKAAPATELPFDVAMTAFPPELTSAIPAVQGYKYVKLADKLLLVSPSNRVVVGEITP
jgi:hypothetical protein